MISSSQSTVGENNDMTELAALLPDSDIVAAIDGDRILNIAAPGLLGEDARKIEHLKNLMRTIEKQVGLNPYEIRQIAFGLKLPADANFDARDLFSKADFTAIVRTANPNANLLDTWTKRLDAIFAFKEEQNSSRKYMDDFKRYRDFKYEKAVPEKLAATVLKFEAALKKTQEINKTLDALPKITTDAKAASNLRAKNKSVADTINNYLNILKADTDTKSYREISIKLLNRWNAVNLDDAQRAAKLAAILKESKDIAPAYRKKYENAKKIEDLFKLLEPAPDGEQQSAGIADKNIVAETDSALDKTIASLINLPATRVKKTTELNVLAANLYDLNGYLSDSLESLNPAPEMETAADTAVAKIKSKTINEGFRQAQREENINGKRMLVFDIDKLDEPQPAEAKPAAPAPKEFPEIAVGFLDERTMVIGFERTVAPFLKRDADYKNTKAVEMLDSAKNPLLAFAVNSTIVKKLTSTTVKPDKKDSADIFSPSVLTNFARDINIYGSVNYDATGGVTNDITMSLGFFKDNVEQIIAPEPTRADAAANPSVDNTFEIAGYQVGKDIFYDLFNSFKAVRASLSFKFEKKKVAALIRSTPRIIERITADNSVPKKEAAKVSKTKPRKLEAIQDLITAPQFYIDLAKVLSGKS